MTGPRMSLEQFLDDSAASHRAHLAHAIGVKPDATATAIPDAALDADIKSKKAKALDAQATADSTEIVNRRRAGNSLDDFVPEWIEAGGRFKQRDDANDAKAEADAATSKANRTVPPLLRALQARSGASK